MTRALLALLLVAVVGCVSQDKDSNDDAGPTCSITAPMPLDRWINATYDTSTDVGMQADITIETEDGATVEVFVDMPITDPPTLTSTADTTGNVTLSSVDLAEADIGELSLQARCTDASGNHTVTPLYEFGVNSGRPWIIITDPTGGETFDLTDDVNTDVEGLQISISVSTSESLRTVSIYPCSSGVGLVPWGVPTTTTVGTATGQIDFQGTSGSMSICATISDVTGSSASAVPVTITVSP